MILGIETSCDETGIAIYDEQRGLVADVLHSQIDVHTLYGGVVPELASRDHIKRMIPLLREVFAEANCTQAEIKAIAYTAGPGLAGALLVGASVASALAWSWGIPAIPVHHMEGHLLAPMLDGEIAFPFVALLVSGGHTQLVGVSELGDYELLGESLDDAAGEAFDKTAKMLGLDYPGGPLLAQYAEKGDRDRFKFPRPMVDRPGLEFSFSGLKTFALNTKNQHTPEGERPDEQLIADISLAFEQAVVDTLYIKCRRALQQTKYTRLVIAGGVSANQSLRKKLQLLGEKEQVDVYYPSKKYCTDNGAMIALAGYYRYAKATNQTSSLSFKVKPRWPMMTLEKLAGSVE